MTRVWKWNRPVTVREVLEDLQQERSIAYTTVMTVMDNLHQKGWVRREAEGRAYRYEAVSTRAAYAAALMNDAWSQSDNPAAALVAFFGMMSEEQRKALRDAARIVGIPESPEPEATPRTRPTTEPTDPVKSAERADRAERAEPTEPPNTRRDTQAENPTDNPSDNPSDNPTENPGSAPEAPGR
ncbi:BlaI/MecI/CopY family transcriptional regulator [Streptomyces sp. TRM72054]|uniref:BlaI/MecI/CopY family transcriptional regulator n=1 Tax=Streptomyces sp. TRM72054 TaxID=2870562 RepID=UPI001C8B27BB|nr:BlaI/MecI/CopY family transcriptional regulator [Streptomyces sp. TRM72054]